MVQQTKNPYQQLESRFRKMGAISGASAILSWDQAVMMPTGSSEVRGEQLAALRGLTHDMLTHDEVGELIEKAKDEPLDDWQKANLREIQHRFERARAIPTELVEALTLATNDCEITWREARKDNNFSMLAEKLGDVVRLTRQSADLLGNVFACDPYDALMADFQPGLARAEIDSIFDDLAQKLPNMIDDALSRQRKPALPEGSFAKDKQKALGTELMSLLGFDFNKGRLDESIHPFCGGVQGDLRITTRYREDEIVSPLMGILHETGHALYGNGLPGDWRHQPVGDDRGMAVHESQSLFVEMQLCRSPAFLSFLSQKLSKTFGDQKAFAPDNLFNLYTKVERGFIRVDADELTYPLHIILRYRLEQALISGDIFVKDLPGAWNELMEKFLGIKPPDDASGCLQDIHWPIGAFGYFPSYTIGAVLAAQFYKQASHDIDGFSQHIKLGNFSPVRDWLLRNIHQNGCFYSFDDLVTKATGKPLSTDDFLDHLTDRYLS